MIEELNDVFRMVVPVRIETYWGVITGGIGTLIASLFGGWNDVLQALVVAMLIDYISGVAAAFFNPDLALNSQRGFKGIIKKILILSLVSFAHYIDLAVGQTVICMAVTWFFLGNEGLSILENAAKCGVPIPERLQYTLEQLAHEKKERETK